MSNSINTSLHIRAKGVYEDERELISMLKSVYRDYWEVKKDGEPRISESEGNYWLISYRIHITNDGDPLIEKNIFHKSPNGDKTKISDSTNSYEGTLISGLEKTRSLIETIAFLSSAYESKERSIGDILRIDESCQQLDVFHLTHDGQQTRTLLQNEFPDINRDVQDYEVVNWQIISPELENWETLKQELILARKNGSELLLPPGDNGQKRTEGQCSTNNQEGSPRIVFGNAGRSPDSRIKFG